MRFVPCLVLGLALLTPNFASATCWGRCHGCHGCYGGCSGCYGGCWGGCYGGCAGGCYGLGSGHGWWGAGYAAGNNYYSTCAGVYSGFYASGNGPYSYPFNSYLPSKGYYYYGYPSAAYIYPSGYNPPYGYAYASGAFITAPRVASGTSTAAAAGALTASSTLDRTSAYFDAGAAGASTSPAPVVATSDSVRVDVTLPDPDAELIIQGYTVKSMGRTRSFVSPPIEPGQAFSYVVTMRRALEGRTVEDTRVVDVRAGGRIALDFTKPPSEPVPAPVVRPSSNYIP